MAICHLLRDSSLTITEKISSAVIPATTVTRINRKGNLEVEDGRHTRNDEEKALEARVVELEKRYVSNNGSERKSKRGRFNQMY